MAGKRAGAPRSDKGRGIEGVPAEKPGKPPHEPTAEQRAQVRKLVTIGLTREQVAAFVGIDDKTLRIHYAEELARGDAEGVAEIAGKLFKAAQGGSFKAQALFLRCKAGWTPRSGVEHDVRAGGSLESLVMQSMGLGSDPAE